MKKIGFILFFLLLIPLSSAGAVSIDTIINSSFYKDATVTNKADEATLRAWLKKNEGMNVWAATAQFSGSKNLYFFASQWSMGFNKEMIGTYGSLYISTSFPGGQADFLSYNGDSAVYDIVTKFGKGAPAFGPTNRPENQTTAIDFGWVDRDRDGDGIKDSDDPYPDDPTNTPPPPADRDGDGIPDKDDIYPDDPTNTPQDDGSWWEWDTILNFLESKMFTLQELLDGIWDGFADLMTDLFVPSGFQERFAGLIEVWKAKFPFIFEIISSVDTLKDKVGTPEKINFKWEGTNIIDYTFLEKPISLFFGTYSLIGLLHLFIKLGLYIFFFGWLFNTLKPQITVG